ncbi:MULTISPECIES: SDR family NAD(P)-dependent oxidoreductase [Actinomadura]|uniref:SDR family NAD(P)-dependent oxidoreductase n=1 Tax=Actinomadura yumaensis TaxID=111807 RepID=A0ABW2CBB7_9ACTN|nr:SDR family NAD(P)-dependent oxidoreductase [Actinomadura sp. J1-007]MWK38129.1 SDR family NAD(P)-dependent oxidoreductase [Actinomadura sp. J1-007]
MGVTFEDEVVVVTGAGGGIGRATALAFAERGARIVAADVDTAAVDRTAALAGALGPRAHAFTVDVGCEETMAEFAGEVEELFGVPGVVVNNAGIGMAGSLLDTGPAAWDRIVEVNLGGVARGCRLFGRQMVERGAGGHIVNIASAAAFTPNRAMAAYATTKAAVLMLSQCLRAELAGHRIGVSAVCPGFVDTGISRSTEYVGLDAAGQDRARQAAARLYRLRGYPPEKVAERILHAVEHNSAVLPVTGEAKVNHALSRLSPGALRLMARIDPTARWSERGRADR